MKKVVGTLAFVLLGLIVVVAVRTASLASRQEPAQTAAPLPIDLDAAAQRFAKALTFETITSDDPGQVARAAFAGLHAHLANAYPKVHAALTREVVGEHSLLYSWPGKNPELPGVIFLAHMDVVPIETGTEGAWTHPPFGGVVADGYIYGRGAMDFKLGVVGVLEAAEALLGEGFAPERTIYFGFGHDEEVGGRGGAVRIVETLAARNVRLALVVDEGLVLTEGMLPGIAAPVALVGLAEKGYLSLQLTAHADGGHSSMPPAQTAVGILARAIARLEEHPMPPHLDGPAGELFDFVAPEMPTGLRLMFANRWLFGPLLSSRLAEAPTTNALLRTTMAATMLHAGIKDNVLPSQASGVINFRIRPGDTRESVTAYVREVIADERVKVEAAPRVITSEPSPVSPSDSAGFRLIATSIRQAYPGAIVAPSLVIAATDARHYTALSSEIYRFSPQRMKSEDRARFHGTNERLSVAGLGEAIHFYAQAMRNTAAL